MIPFSRPIRSVEYEVFSLTDGNLKQIGHTNIQKTRIVVLERIRRIRVPSHAPSKLSLEGDVKAQRPVMHLQVSWLRSVLPNNAVRLAGGSANIRARGDTLGPGASGESGMLSALGLFVLSTPPVSLER
jgi:hypothetical protein